MDVKQVESALHRGDCGSRERTCSNGEFEEGREIGGMEQWRATVQEGLGCQEQSTFCGSNTCGTEAYTVLGFSES